MHHLFFVNASSIDDYIKHWSKKSVKRVYALLKEKVSEPADLERLQKMWKLAQKRVYPRLKRLRRELKRNKVDSYLTNVEHFEYVVAMVKAGRIRPICANLLDDEGLLGIGKAARDLGVPIRLLYLSNAEGYWRYKKQFKANMIGLYTDDKGLVLRTISTWTTNKDYRYYVQSLPEFQKWMAMDFVTYRLQMLHRRKLKGPDDIQFSVVKASAEAARKRHERRQRKKRKKSRKSKKKAE